MKDLALTKESSNEQIKAYFNGVLAIKESNEPYPINLDDVWMLVYSERGKAVRSLKENFIENEDFRLFAQNGKNSKGRPKDEYYLSLSCFEYFIARKVRPVFEVYRQVFHKVAEQTKPLSVAEFLLQQAQLAVEHDKRLSSVENDVAIMKQKQNESNQFLFKVEVSQTKVPELSTRDKAIQLVCNYGRANNIDIHTVWNKVYQRLERKPYSIAIKRHRRDKKESYLAVAERIGCINQIYDIISGMVRDSKCTVNLANTTK